MRIGLSFLAMDIYCFIYFVVYFILRAFSLCWCSLITNSARWLSAFSLTSSHIMKNKSNLDIIGAEMFMLCFSDFDLLYLPKRGFAAANMLVRAFNVAYTPAFASDIVCCYIAS